MRYRIVAVPRHEYKYNRDTEQCDDVITIYWEIQQRHWWSPFWNVVLRPWCYYKTQKAATQVISILRSQPVEV